MKSQLWRQSTASFLPFSIGGMVLFLVFGSCTAGQQPPEATPSDSPYKESFIDVNGQTLYMRTYSSEGPPILFMGSGGKDLDSKENKKLDITDRFSVYGVDLRGHGRSSWPASGYRWKEDLSEDVAQLLEKTFDEPVILVGASLGAQVAATVAAYHPERVRALILNELPTGDISTVFPYLRNQLKLQAMPFEERVKFLMEKGRTEEKARKMATTVDKINRAAMEELMAGKASFDIMTIISRIKCPAFFMMGNTQKGSMVTDESRVEIRKQVPHAKISIWSDAGHNFRPTDPDRYLREVNEFLTGLLVNGN